MTVGAAILLTCRQDQQKTTLTPGLHVINADQIRFGYAKYKIYLHKSTRITSVYESGDGESARFTFSRGWAHLAAYGPVLGESLLTVSE